MVDIKNICKSLNVSIVSVMKNPEMLNVVLDNIKTNKNMSACG